MPRCQSTLTLALLCSSFAQGCEYALMNQLLQIYPAAIALSSLRYQAVITQPE